MSTVYHQGPQTHDERASTLCALDEDTLAVFIRKKAMSEEENTDWLDTMLEMGMFDLADEVQDAHNWWILPENTVDRIKAMMSFLESSCLSKESEDPVYGKLEHEAPFLFLPATDAMKAYFVRFCDRMMQQTVQIHHNHPGNESNDLDLTDGCDDDYKRLQKQRIDVWSAAIVCACALGLPEVARRFAQDEPKALEKGQPASMVGMAMSDHVHASTTDIEFTPRFFAMQYSNREAMDVIKEVGAVSWVSEEIYACKKFGISNKDGSFSDQHYSLTDALGVFYSPVCHPSAFAQALAWEKKSIVDNLLDKGVWEERLESLIQAKGIDSLSLPYHVSFEQEGLFEIIPNLTAELACCYGRTGILERLKGPLDWKMLEDRNPLWHVYNHIESRGFMALEDKEKYDQTMAAFCQRAVADGHPEVILKQNASQEQANTGLSFPQPLTFLIHNGFNKTLLRMLDVGLSPTEPPMMGALTPLAIAAENYVSNDSTESLLRAYSARSVTQSILSQMDFSPFMAKPTKA